MAGSVGGGSVVGRTTSAPEASLLLLFSDARQQTVVQQGSLSAAAVPEDSADDGSRVLLAATSEHGQACAYHSGPVVITPKCVRGGAERADDMNDGKVAECAAHAGPPQFCTVYRQTFTTHLSRTFDGR